MTSSAPSPSPALGPAALYYASRLQWAVFPLHSIRAGRCSCNNPDCGNAGKHPRTARGFKDATTDLEQIEAWWSSTPDANIGIATGEASGFVVLDVDPRNGGDDALAALLEQHGPLPLTPLANTGGGGRHFLFALPPDGAPPARKLAPGIDFKSAGGYIVVAPSGHLSGRSYAWAAEARPGEVEFAPLPPWLLELARRKPRPAPAPPPPRASDHPLAERVRRASAYLDRLPPAISGQDGHQALWTAALAVCCGFDLPDDAALELLEREYNPRCRPPWSRAELEHKVDGAANADLQRGYLLDDPRRQWKAPPPPPPRQNNGPAETSPPTAEEEAFDLQAAVAAIAALPKTERTAAALDPAFVAAAATLPDTSPAFALLRAELKKLGVSLSTWDKAVRLARPPAPPAPASSPAPRQKPEGEEWRDELNETKGGGVKTTYGNIVLVLRNAPAYAGRFTFNEMRLTPCLDGAPLGDADVGRIREALERDWGIEASADNLKQAIRQVAEERRFHPVREYLSTLEWDKHTRIAEVARCILGISKPTALHHRMLTAWFVSAVARAMRPGCKVDTALVLVGKQGFLKSTFFAVLGGAFFSDTAMDISSKDGLMQLHAAWIYEWGEIESVTSRKHAAEVKGFITSPADNFRPPYASATTINPRSTVIVGSTNEGQFLVDATGSRRFWILRITERIDLPLLTAWRDQLWAEAVHLYNEGYQWWLSSSEEGAREEDAAEHRVEDATTDAVRSWVVSLEAGNILARQGYLLAADVLRGAMKLEPGRWGRSEQTRVGIALAELRWRKERPFIGGDRMWVYRPPPSAPGPEVVP